MFEADHYDSNPMAEKEGRETVEAALDHFRDVFKRLNVRVGESREPFSVICRSSAHGSTGIAFT